MKSVIQKTFGGLSTQYYIRQFLFGLIFPAIYYFILTQGQGSESLFSIGLIVLLVLNTALYPYSRYVYESVVEYLMGDNLFFTNAIFVLIVKLVTMLLCWGFAIFIAPIGLAYLYYHHSKNNNEE